MLSQTESSYLIESFNTVAPTTEQFQQTGKELSRSRIIRLDGRDNLRFRPIELIDRFSNFSNSSCRAKLLTNSNNVSDEILVGVRVEIEEREFDRFGSGRLEVSIDLTPSALMVLRNDPTQEYNTHLNSIYSPLSRSRQFRVSSLHCLSIYRYVICLAIRSALFNLKVPKTREISYSNSRLKGDNLVQSSLEKSTIQSDLFKTHILSEPTMIKDEEEKVDGTDLTEEMMGIKGLLRDGNRINRSKKLGSDNLKSVDFELVESDGNQGEVLKNLDEIPLIVTLNILEGQIFLDATLEEEMISNNRLILSFKKVKTGRRTVSIEDNEEEEEERIKLVNLFQIGSKSEIDIHRLKSIVREGARVAEELSKIV
ncbi:expressed protein [Phakopsora pachyrhizi]|uniref:Ribosomal RNA-processing protein 42 n=1 Tax=Phakopsora pachyrhizi TaxID=170000 RepID=A0AAV0BTP0_PHAPC|nr:expressed protein [Phakopsora pachyrhizi]